MTRFTPHIRRQLAIIFMSVMLCAPGLSSAQVPGTIAYGGFLRDNEGNPITGNAAIQFDLYSADAGGSSLWTETHAAVPVLSGVFSVALGSVTTFVSAGLTFDKPLFLGITVDGEELDARTALHSSPYSLATAPLVLTIDVDCGGGQSLADALAAVPVTTQLTMDISGTCTGNLTIKHNNLTIKSTDDTGVIQATTPAPDAFNAAIGIEGRKNVNFDNVTIRGADGDDTAMRGIALSDNANVALLSGAIVEDFNGEGILIVESSNLDLFSGSIVRNNDGTGITTYASSHLDVTDSSVEGNGGDGIFAGLNSGLDVRSSTVSGNTRNGVVVREGSAARIRDGSTIEDNGTTGDGNYHVGLFVDEGSTARIMASTVSTTAEYGSDGPAVAVYRNSNLRVTGGSTISAPHAPDSDKSCPSSCPRSPFTAGSGGTAFDVEMNSTLRLDSGKSTVVGNIYTFNLSTVDLRNVEQTGNMVMADGLFANLRLRDQSPEDGTATIGGTLIYNGQPISIRKGGHEQRALIQFVTCVNGNSAPGDIDFFDDGNDTNNFFGCP